MKKASSGKSLGPKVIKSTPAIPYTDLIKTVKGAVSSGLIAAQKTLEYQRLLTYWQIGQAIEHFVRVNEQEELGEALYTRISRDLYQQTALDLSWDTIGRMVAFYNHYPRFPKKTTLTFTHYLALQRVKNDKARLRLEEQAIKENMTVSGLKTAVADLLDEPRSASLKNKTRLPLRRGEPYIYSAREETTLTGRKEFRVDCGFKINIPFPKNNPYTPDQSRIVRSEKRDDGYSIHRYKAGREKLYTYQAWIVKVIDGDTMDVRIDVGFDIALTDRVRLKSINAPEVKTNAGIRARKFLTGYLKQCQSIVIRTNKAEMYGRWLADIFVLPGEEDPKVIAAEGIFLNQVLLDEGVAGRYG